MVLCIGFPCARWFTKVNVSDKTYDAHFKVGKQENFRSINPPTPEVKVLSSKFFYSLSWHKDAYAQIRPDNLAPIEGYLHKI